MPHKAGVWFVRDQMKMFNVDRDYIEKAKKEIEMVHEHTSKTENIEDYHKTITGLCKWKSGQCDFYDICRRDS